MSNTTALTHAEGKFRRQFECPASLWLEFEKTAERERLTKTDLLLDAMRQRILRGASPYSATITVEEKQSEE